jgi:hypothetical protein
MHFFKITGDGLVEYDVSICSLQRDKIVGVKYMEGARINRTTFSLMKRLTEVAVCPTSGSSPAPPAGTLLIASPDMNRGEP